MLFILLGYYPEDGIDFSGQMTVTGVFTLTVELAWFMVPEHMQQPHDVMYWHGVSPAGMVPSSWHYVGAALHGM